MGRGRPKKESMVESKQVFKKSKVKEENREEENIVEKKVEEKVVNKEVNVSKKENKVVQEDNSIYDEIYGDLVDLTEEEDDHFFASGSLVIDSVISNGRGIPLGKFISINSESAIGKSTIAIHIARNCCAQGYNCLYLDTECALNPSQIESFSMVPFVQNRTFKVKKIRTYRELDDCLTNVVKDKNLRFIFIDSLTDLIPDQYIENNISDITQPALEATLQSRILKKHKYLMSEAGITVFFILQNRTKIAMSYGQQTTVQASGGKAVLYHMDITLELIKKDYLTKTVKGYDKPIPYGTECYIRSNKNRYAPPMIPMLIHIIFGKGVSNSGAIATALIANGIAKLPNKKKILIEYEGEMKEFLGKPRFEEFIKEHLDYYKDVIENKCGGIKLLRDEDITQPVVSNNLHTEEGELDSSILDIEESNEE